MKGKAMVISAQECCGAIAAVEFIEIDGFICSTATCENCGYVEQWAEALSVADLDLIRDAVLSWANMPTRGNGGWVYGPTVIRESITIWTLNPGKGRHSHGTDCPDPCYRHCDDSDVIVDVWYGTQGYAATYAMLNGRPVLWAN
jgi:hypothetical protein